MEKALFHVMPSGDLLGALSGGDGELFPVPCDRMHKHGKTSTSTSSKLRCSTPEIDPNGADLFHAELVLCQKRFC